MDYEEKIIDLEDLYSSSEEEVKEAILWKEEGWNWDHWTPEKERF